MGKSLSNKHGLSARKFTTDAIKAASKRVIPKTAEAIGDLIGNKIADKITSFSKKTSTKELLSDEIEEDNYSEKKIHISRRKTKKLLMN